jgi:RNA polymerase sigma-70 factor (ECF subfamily)
MRCVPRFLAARNAALGRPLGDEELADLAQDVLVLLWTKLPSYAGKGSLETWSYRFCVLEIMNFLRRLRRRPLALDPPSQTVAGTDPEVEHDPAARLAREETEALLRHLSEREAEVVRLRHFEGLEAREVAEHLGLSLSSVKTHYYRALEKLRPLLVVRAEKEHR